MYQFLLVINTFYNANNFFLFLSEFIQQDKLKLMW